MSTPKYTGPIQPHLFFEGRCEEAIEFYRRALGAEVVMVMRFKDSPEAPPPGCVPAGCEGKVMHAELRIGETVMMLADARCTGKPVFQGFCMNLTVATAGEVDPIFNALAEGGQVQIPLAKTFFSARFGMVVDKFGVGWMIVARPQQGK